MIALHSILSLLLTGLYLLVVVYLIKGWAALKQPAITGAPLTTKVTILIAARDEEERIRYTIEDIIAQDYPRHLTEVIIVDDHSTDNTADIIRSYAADGITLIQLQADWPLNSYKKKAIAEAIERSGGDLMVATDADCRMGPKWLSSIVAYYETNDKVMISSPVTYFEERSLFERLQTLEFSYLIGIGAAFIGNGRASTCNGANLAYRKDVFYEVGGFKGIDDLASGDDELLLQKVAVVYPHRIGFFKNQDAVVYTHAKHTLQEFLQQRRRWASKSTRYKDKKIVALAVCIWLFNLSLIANALLSFYDSSFFRLFLVQFLLKFLFEAVFLIPITGFFKRAGLVGLLIILAPIHIVYFVYVGLIGNTSKYSWKGRTVR
ncbi:glycosyltransferase family 2 protein [Mucilaginibacter glaciei]|uniref:Glycosyltransferase n=1 Tax=Mucilaginibacter glaciei TaxID=2772109 RepID=A0A926NV91_9SPHI|nr:glycosyltransferase [Mucilaginibacter glaciei]MBD1395197.1 glycosyltransferase [Mucilaginibacter glaciei]